MGLNVCFNRLLNCMYTTKVIKCEMKQKQTHQVVLATVDHPKALHQTLKLTKRRQRKKQLATKNYKKLHFLIRENP